MRYLCLIPARGGSKGIPGKNMVQLNGNPLIWHTVTAAQNSMLKDFLFLSSDSNEIINYCRSLGIDVGYRRPDELSTDQASTVDVIIDALLHLKSKGVVPETIVLLQPTSPLRSGGEIDAAIVEFENRKLMSLVGVTTMREHPFECISVSQNGPWSFLKKPTTPVSRRQDYAESFYFINGALYIINTEYFLKRRQFVIEGETFPFRMSPANAIDIDEPLDLCVAEAYFQFWKPTEKG